MTRREPASRLPERRRILSWVYVGRLSLAAAIFAAAAWVWKDVGATTTLAATLIFVIAIAFTAASFLYTHVGRNQPERGYLYGQVIFDAVMVTWVVHLTGGRESAFAPLYILVICAASILLPIVGGILVGLLASVMYVGAIFWGQSGNIDAAVTLQIALFAAVAMVTGYLGDRLRRAGTALGQVEQELQMLRLDTDDIMRGIGTGILTVDGSGRLAYLNPAGAEILRMEPPRWMGREVVPELESIAPGLGSVIRRTVENGAGVRRYETGETVEGMVLGVSTTLLERPEGPPSVTAIFQDITERKRVDALRGRAERLEAVAELSASLAHEIKNPLASIRSAAEQLTSAGVDAEDREVLGGLVVRESDRLSRLLTDFLDFARVKVRARKQVDLGRVGRHVADLVRAHPHAHGRVVELRVEAGETGLAVLGDEDLLHRALLNLALNGVQWAAEGGRVEVAVEAVENEAAAVALGSSAAVRLRVSDTGPGIPDEDAEHVFNPFFTLRPGGTGLGLALVARAAEAHGGTVFVDVPQAPWGTTITMYLPSLAAGGADRAEREPQGEEAVR